MGKQPDLYALMDHLRKCPLEFLQSSNLKNKGTVHTQALTLDVYRKMWGDPFVSSNDLPTTASFNSFSENMLMCTHLTCWLFSNPYFHNDSKRVPEMHLFITSDLPEISALVPFQGFIEDEERTEEFVRLALKRCAVVPQGETQQEAADKLKSINTVERARVLKETQQALERVKAIRKKMEDDKAREAANVYGRE